MSLPCQLGINGVTSVVVQKLLESERCGLKFSAAMMYEVQAGLVL